MKLSNAFSVPLRPAEAWQVLLDVERIAKCVPGAEIIETLDDNTYKGRISVKLGPVNLAFKGKVAFVEIDEAQHCAQLEAVGTDASGRGGAQAKTLFKLLPKGEETEVQVDTDLQLSGAVAQYGRASGIIADMAAQIVDEFADCLRRQLDRPTSQEAAVTSGHSAEIDETPARPLSGLGLTWRVVLRRIRRWFGGRQATN